MRSHYFPKPVNIYLLCCSVEIQQREEKLLLQMVVRFPVECFSETWVTALVWARPKQIPGVTVKSQFTVPSQGSRPQSWAQARSEKRVAQVDWLKVGTF